MEPNFGEGAATQTHFFCCLFHPLVVCVCIFDPFEMSEFYRIPRRHFMSCPPPKMKIFTLGNHEYIVTSSYFASQKKQNLPSRNTMDNFLSLRCPPYFPFSLDLKTLSGSWIELGKPRGSLQTRTKLSETYFLLLGKVTVEAQQRCTCGHRSL